MLPMSLGQRSSEFGRLLDSGSSGNAARTRGNDLGHIGHQAHRRRTELALGETADFRWQEVRVQESAAQKETGSLHRLQREQTRHGNL